MRVGLVGYGKMGKAIHEILLERGHEISFATNTTPQKNELSQTDVCIEFSNPKVALKNLKTILAEGVPVVCGTTGWLADWEKAKEAVSQSKSGMIYASNFSLGVNLTFHLNRFLAKMIAPYLGSYHPYITEIHHTQKLDAPSGTAITLAEGILQETPQLENWTLSESTSEENPNQLEIKAIREDNVPGTHVVDYVSEIDSIQIQHTAHSRKGFALGAVIAAEWLVGKTGMFGMDDVLGINKNELKQ